MARRFASCLRPLAAAALALALAGPRAAAEPADDDPAADDAALDDEPASTLRLSLADALALAARQAPAIRRAAFDAAQADGDARAADQRPWTVAISGGGERRQPGLAPAAGEVDDAAVAEARLGHRFVTGAALDATAGTRAPADGGPATSTLSVGLVVPLLQGARPWRVDGRRAAAGHLAAAADHRLRAITDDERAAVATAYWELVFARADREIRRASLDAARTQVRLTRALERRGQVPRSAVLAAQQAAAIRAEALVGADQAIAERSLLLRDRLGLPVGPGELLIEPADDPPTGGPGRLDVAARLAAAEATNPTLAGADQAARAAARLDQAAADDALPGLDLGLTAATIDGPGAGLDAGAAAATGAPAAATADPAVTLTATLTLRHDLGGPRAGLRDAARIAARRARYERGEARRQVRLTVMRAVVRVEGADRRVQLTADAEARAVELARAEAARFGAGEATVFDVLARQDELEDARRRALRAAIDRALAEVELTRAVGSEP